ncbi:hypothetical protein DXD13_00965 [Agathobacter rectalis]|uniref:Uncharacterized protein n=1 Tax=Agathobacter rectalis TaxID=39491 RepID=A0A3E4M7G7_9FIRM|nr:hypothetical protein DW898_07770 [Ruminococcus sp. AM41-2AC]RGI20629.1 hypothetical protein DXC28_14910 [Ruminococcus sp. OM08-9BH]RGK45778.1 hypothetical protein DXD13_00965 [Agathobacter rectalis]HAR01287.1 hypothetical protein [Eubacterium sp.]
MSPSWKYSSILCLHLLALF